MASSQPAGASAVMHRALTGPTPGPRQGAPPAEIHPAPLPPVLASSKDSVAAALRGRIPTSFLEQAAAISRIKAMVAFLDPHTTISDDAAALVNDIASRFVEDATIFAGETANMRERAAERARSVAATSLASTTVDDLLAQQHHKSKRVPVLEQRDVAFYVREVWPALPVPGSTFEIKPAASRATFAPPTAATAGGSSQAGPATAHFAPSTGTGTGSMGTGVSSSSGVRGGVGGAPPGVPVGGGRAKSESGGGGKDGKVGVERVVKAVKVPKPPKAGSKRAREEATKAIGGSGAAATGTSTTKLTLPNPHRQPGQTGGSGSGSGSGTVSASVSGGPPPAKRPAT